VGSYSVWGNFYVGESVFNFAWGLAASDGIMSGAKDKNINVPGASLWQYLQTEFGTKLALAMLL